MKLILGAAETWQPGWYATNEQWLDVTRADHWDRLFAGRRIVTHVVAEHVFEHLTEDEARAALAHIARHLVPGGRVRIAVPDGYHPDPVYRRHVGLDGIGDDAGDHKQLLDLDRLTALMTEQGFRTEHLEGYRADGTLVQRDWRDEDGYVRRSRRNGGRGNLWSFPDADTSLIVDGVLP